MRCNVINIIRFVYLEMILMGKRGVGGKVGLIDLKDGWSCSLRLSQLMIRLRVCTSLMDQIPGAFFLSFTRYS